jgi:hypothetical protein
MPLTQVSPGLLDSNAQYYGFKNRLINSAMVIDQRNNGASVTIGLNAITYTLDRWFGYANQASKFSIQQNAGSVTPPAGFNSYLGVTSLAATTAAVSEEFVISQRLEGFNVADLNWGTANAQTVTLSFWVRSSLTGTFGGSLSNSAGNRSYVFSFAINAANTWEQKTITIAGDTTGTWLTNNSTGIRLAFDLGSGSNFKSSAGSWSAGNFGGVTGGVSVIGTNGATFYITGVQLEKGSTATSFDYRPYGTELSLCQRYFEKSYEQNVAVGSASTIGYSSLNNPDQGSAVYIFSTDRFRVEKRAAATMLNWDLAGTVGRTTQYTLGGLARTDGANNVVSYTGAQTGAVMIVIQTASTAATYQWTASAEL